MAKIPTYSPNTRSGGADYHQVTNPGAARAMGEAVAGFGKGVQRLGDDIDQYVKEKNKVDDALYVAELRQRAAEKAIEAETFAKTNPNAARDGSSAQTDFDSVFGSVKEEVTNTEDRRRRAMGLQVVNEVEASHKKKVLTYQVTRHNDYVLEKSDELLNGYTARIENDPNELVKTMQEFDALGSQMPLTGKDGKSYMHAGRRQMVTAAIESFAEKGDFTNAKALLDNPSAASLYSQDERKKLSKELTERYRSQARFTWATEDHEHTAMKREKADNEEKVEQKLFNDLLTSESPAKRAEVLQDAQAAVASGVMRPNTYKSLAADQRRIDVEQSADLRRNYVVQYFNGKSFGEIKAQVTADMAESRMTQTDGMALLNSIRTQAKRESIDPRYKEQKQRARDYIKSRVTPSGGSSIMGAIYGQQDKRMLVEINEEVARLEAAGEKDPMMAARLATAKVIGIQQFSDSPNYNVIQKNQSIPELQKYGESVVQRIKASKSISAEAKKEALLTLKEVSIRIEALKQKEEYDNLLKLKEAQPK